MGQYKAKKDSSKTRKKKMFGQGKCLIIVGSRTTVSNRCMQCSRECRTPMLVYLCSNQINRMHLHSLPFGEAAFDRHAEESEARRPPNQQFWTPHMSLFFCVARNSRGRGKDAKQPARQAARAHQHAADKTCKIVSFQRRGSFGQQ